MKRLLIIALVLFGIWSLFHSEDIDQELLDIDEVMTEENNQEDETTASSEDSSVSATETPAEETPKVAEKKDASPARPSVRVETPAPIPPVRVRPRNEGSRAEGKPVVTGVVAAPKAKATSKKMVTTPVEEAPATRVKVFLYEWDIDFSDKTIPEGKIAFEVHNTGRFTHNFGIRGVKDFGKVIPGESKVFEVSLAAGSHEACSTRRVDKLYDFRDGFSVY